MPIDADNNCVDNLTQKELRCCLVELTLNGKKTRSTWKNDTFRSVWWNKANFVSPTTVSGGRLVLSTDDLRDLLKSYISWRGANRKVTSAVSEHSYSASTTHHEAQAQAAYDVCKQDLDNAMRFISYRKTFYFKALNSYSRYEPEFRHSLTEFREQYMKVCANIQIQRNFCD